jgi:tetratricopeptide (TPR) repeat protein
MNSQLEVIKKVSILIDRKKYEEAKYFLVKFISENKNIKIDLKFYYQLYQVFNALREFKSAKKYIEKCLKINENNHIFLNNLANIFLLERNIAKAEMFYLKSLEKKTDYLIANINIAILYEYVGKIEKAKKFYLKAIDLSPKKIAIYYNLSRLDKNFITKKIIKFLDNLLKNEKIELLDKAYCLFLLAENERKKKFYNKEIEFLKKAHQNLFDSDLNINNQSLSYWLKIISNKYDKFNFINEKKNYELNNLNPIFIVGLPRSGSTIVEALISSGGSIVENLGETNIFNGLIVNNYTSIKDKKINNIDLDKINKIIFNFIKDKNILNTKKNFFTDKSLENFFYIDVILKIFPNAKFVNTFRNLEDNIFAIFHQALTMSWTHSIENILNYIDNYLKIINFFKKKYPDKIFSVDLEELTNKPEEVSKELYQFCGLKWSENALKFHNRKDLVVSTASNIQVRKAINKYDHEKYRPYKEFLKIFSNKYDWLSQE